MDTTEFILKQEDEICKQSDFLNNVLPHSMQNHCIVGISGNLILDKISSQR